MAWLPTFSKRKPITITGGASGAQTDFQLKLATVYAAAMQGDFDDLRFTQVDGTTLIDAWLESKVDNTSAVVFAEFPTTPANTVEQDYYMYYGNAGAASDWDIGATFVFGDGFDNANNWTISDTNAINVESGVMRVKAVTGGKNAYVTSKPTLGDNFVMEYDYKPTAGYTHYGVIGVGLTEQTAYAGGNNGIFHWHYGGASSGNQSLHSRSMVSGSNYPGTYIQPYATNELYKFQCAKLGSTVTCKIWDTSHSESSPNVSNALTCRNSYEYTYIDIFTRPGYTQPAADIDNFRIRKYVANPPTYAFGAEESAPTGAIMNQLQKYNLGADLYNGAIIA